jgi:hypothetical protein
MCPSTSGASGSTAWSPSSASGRGRSSGNSRSRPCRATSIALLAFHQRPPRPRHRFDPRGEANPELVAADRVRDRDRARQRRSAEPVDGYRRDRVREARSQRGPARDVPHPLVRWIHAPGGDVLDALERDAHPLAGRDHRLSEQIIGADMRQRAAVAPHRRPHTTENKGISHRDGSPSGCFQGDCRIRA